jgi:hypothetical protein
MKVMECISIIQINNIKENDFLILLPTKYKTRDETLNLRTKDVIMCYLIRALAQFRRW